MPPSRRRRRVRSDHSDHPCGRSGPGTRYHRGTGLGNWLHTALQRRPGSTDSSGRGRSRYHPPPADTVALGTGAGVGEEPAPKLPDDQCPQRDRCRQAGLSRAVPAPSMHHPSRRFLRVATARQNTAAVRAAPGGRWVVRSGRYLGALGATRSAAARDL